MSTLELLLLFLGMGAITYATRRALLRLPGNLLSPRLKNGLTFIPIGIFAALIFPSLFVQNGSFVIQPLQLVAAGVCLVTMALSRNVFLSFGVSLGLVVVFTLISG